MSDHDPLFDTHRLNADGIKRVNDVKSLFTRLVEELYAAGPRGAIGFPNESDSRRCAAIVKTKLEEACFFAVKAVATQAIYQEHDT